VFKRAKKVIVAAVVALALVVTPVAASNGEGDVPTFDAWLQGASGPLVSVIAGFSISLLIDLWPAYQSWADRWKRVVYFALCLIVPVGAATLRAVLGYVPWGFDPLFWHALWHGFAAGLAGTAVHVKTRRASRLLAAPRY